MTERVPAVEELTVQIFADGADIVHLRRLAGDDRIKGFTTNPTLMRKAGVCDYVAFAHEAVEIVGDRPISFEVFSDDFREMETQARCISEWGHNVFVKIPVTDTNGVSALPVIRTLVGDGVKVNVTALMTVDQVEAVSEALDPDVPSFVSLFAGRIADTGRDPVPHVRAAVDVLAAIPASRLIWASPRELLNVFQADAAGCHVITATHDVLAKLGLIGKDLMQFSLETVRMFYDDAAAAGYAIDVAVASGVLSKEGVE